MGKQKTDRDMAALLKRPDVRRAVDYAQREELRRRASAGGRARVASMSTEERREHALAMNRARWGAPRPGTKSPAKATRKSRRTLAASP